MRLHAFDFSGVVCNLWRKAHLLFTYLQHFSGVNEIACVCERKLSLIVGSRCLGVLTNLTMCACILRQDCKSLWELSGLQRQEPECCCAVPHLRMCELKAMSGWNYYCSIWWCNFALLPQFYEGSQGNSCVRAIEHSCSAWTCAFFGWHRHKKLYKADFILLLTSWHIVPIRLECRTISIAGWMKWCPWWYVVRELWGRLNPSLQRSIAGSVEQSVTCEICSSCSIH